MTPDAMQGPWVVGSVLASTADAALQGVRAAPGGCGLVELRADHLRAAEIAELVPRAGRPLIVTLRRADAGGCFTGSEDERRRALLAALEAGARFVDVEWDETLADLAQEPSYAARVVLSHHGGPCRLADLQRTYRAMAARAVGPLKIVPRAEGVDEILALRSLLAQARDDRRPLVAFATGRSGAISRLLAPAWGSWATYGFVPGCRPTAEGQYPVSDMLGHLDVLHVGPDTRLFALVGANVGGSPSPAIHAAGYRRAGLDARYLAIETDDWKRLLALLPRGAGLGLDAFAVTMPFKADVARRCAELDSAARQAAAVNTVRVEGQTWHGFNTDGPAALDRIRARLEPRGLRVAVVGAGGTGRAFAAALREAGADVVVFNRGLRRARLAARLTGVTAAPLSELATFDWDVLMQATPLGSAGERVLDRSRLRGKLVLDAVYGPRPTPLVEDGRATGLDVVDGHELLAAQAVRQFRLMTGRAARFDELLAAGLQWQNARPA